MAWTSPRTWVAAELVTAALLNTHLRDNLNAIQGGLISLVKVPFAGATSDPALSVATQAMLYYNSSTNRMKISKNTGAYVEFGEAAGSDWIAWSGGI